MSKHRYFTMLSKDQQQEIKDTLRIKGLSSKEILKSLKSCKVVKNSDGTYSPIILKSI